MAVIPVDLSLSASSLEIIKWSTITDSDTVAAHQLSTKSMSGRASMTVSGVLTTATVGLEGSHDGVTWVDVKDSLGAVIAVVAADIPASGAAMVSVPDLFKHMRPRTPGGAVTQDIDVTLHVKAA